MSKLNWDKVHISLLICIKKLYFFYLRVKMAGFTVELNGIDTRRPIFSFDGLLTRINLYTLQNNDMVYAISDDLKRIIQVFYYNVNGRVTLDSDEYTPTQIIDENTLQLGNGEIFHVYGILSNPVLGDIQIRDRSYRGFDTLTPVYVAEGVPDIQFHLERIDIRDIRVGDFIINGESDMSSIVNIEFDEEGVVFDTEHGENYYPIQDFRRGILISIIRLNNVLGG
jgi:hypothetical protein